MTRITMTALLTALLVAAPAAAQTHGSHQHGQQQTPTAGAGGAEKAHEHCAMHAGKHGADAASHDAHAAHGAGTSHAGGMMEQHATAPKMLLKHREMLQLTANQVERLEALQAAHRADCEKRMAAVKAAESAAAAALASAPAADLATYEAKLREAANNKVDCKVDMARISQAGAALLTEAQRTHLAHMSHTSH